LVALVGVEADGLGEGLGEVLDGLGNGFGETAGSFLGGAAAFILAASSSFCTLAAI
jgi:hypothetical protein